MNSPSLIKSPLAALALGLAVTFGLGTIANAQAAEAALAPSIEFLDTVYSLAWTSDPTPNYSKREYLPEDEELPYYFNMLLVEQLLGISVTDTVRAQVEFLKARREEDVSAKILDLMENPDTGEVLLVFVLTADDEEHEVIWEWNAYRYSPAQRPNGEESVRLFGYSKRSYGNDDSAYDFIEEVSNRHAELVNAVATAQAP